MPRLYWRSKRCCGLTSLVSLCRGLVLLNCAGAMNRKGLTQDGALLKIMSPIFAVVEYFLQRPKIASFLFDKFSSTSLFLSSTLKQPN